MSIARRHSRARRIPSDPSDRKCRHSARAPEARQVRAARRQRVHSTCVSFETSQVLARTFCAGNFSASSSRVAGKSFSLRAQRTTFAPSRRKCSAMSLPSPWLPPVMSALRFFKFHIGASDGKMLDTGQVFQFLFQKTICIHEHPLAHLEINFAQSSWRNCGHSVQTTTASAPFNATAGSAASETGTNSAGRPSRPGQRR